MQSVRRFLSTNLGSAVTGGLIVLIGGIVLIETGAVDANNDSTSSSTVAPAALARPASDSKGLTVHDIYQRDAEGVAFIRSEIVQKTQSPFDLFPQQQRSVATGSGFLFDGDGHILTNAHVVDGAQKVQVELGDGDTQDAQVVGSDPSTDIAVLKVDDTSGV